MPEALELTVRIICCYTELFPGTERAVRAYAPGAEFVPTPAEDTLALWRAIRERWTGERDLMIIEQDIEIGPGTVASLENCPQGWCSFAYPIFSTVRLDVGTGCVKFSAALQRAVPPTAIEAWMKNCSECRGQGCWWHVDTSIARVLMEAGHQVCDHGDVTHLHDYSGVVGLFLGDTFEWEATPEQPRPPVTTFVSWPVTEDAAFRSRVPVPGPE